MSCLLYILLCIYTNACNKMKYSVPPIFTRIASLGRVLEQSEKFCHGLPK